MYINTWHDCFAFEPNNNTHTGFYKKKIVFLFCAYKIRIKLRFHIIYSRTNGIDILFFGNSVIAFAILYYRCLLKRIYIHRMSRQRNDFCLESTRVAVTQIVIIMIIIIQ